MDMHMMAEISEDGLVQKQLTTSRSYYHQMYSFYSWTILLWNPIILVEAKPIVGVKVELPKQNIPVYNKYQRPTLLFIFEPPILYLQGCLSGSVSAIHQCRMDTVFKGSVSLPGWGRSILYPLNIFTFIHIYCPITVLTTHSPLFIFFMIFY